MAYLYHDIPPLEILVREEFLRNMEDGFGRFHKCVAFGLDSMPGNTLLFHCLLEDGGIFSRLPPHAFCHKECEPMELHNLVLWDCFSYYPTVYVASFLKSKRMSYVDRDKNKHWGQYVFTVDWAHENEAMPDVGFSEAAGQHKTGHVIALDNGNYAIQPNNRVLVKEPSFVTKETLDVHRLLHSHKWTVENKEKWSLSDDDSYHYEVNEK